MPKLSRRRFVAASAASAAGVAAPAWGATGPDAEIVVIGAGAAGIAAARRVATTKARLIVLEASRPHRRPLLHRDDDLRRAL